MFNDTEIEFTDEDSVYKKCDFIAVLGGDGSILRAAKHALIYDKPVLGINLGRVGYMAELEKDELSYVSNIFSDKFAIEKRMTVSVHVRKCDGVTV